jgi:hypothetical protein
MGGRQIIRRLCFFAAVEAACHTKRRKKLTEGKEVAIILEFADGGGGGASKKHGLLS